MGRSAGEAMSADEKAIMDAAMDKLYASLDGCPAGVALSVLAQVFVGNLGDAAELSDQQFLDRTLAMLAMSNIMRASVADVEFTQATLAESVHDLTSIIKCGSRPFMIASMASVLVASVANGRRDATAEAACVDAIKSALDSFDVQLGSVSSGG